MAKRLLAVNFQNWIFRAQLHNRRFHEKDKKEGRYFPGGFTYYPRHPDEIDPPYEPTKLFMVHRIKPLKGNPYWDREILKHFKLDGNDFAIVKNLPENNGRLWRIKHLVKITPIHFPNGEPTDADINSTFLRETGDFIVAKNLEVPKERQETTDKFLNDNKRLDGNTLRRQSRLKWLSGW